MPFSDSERAFLEANHGAAMVTIGSDGLPKVARVAVALVDGKLWSSGTQGRVRTERLRRDPRCTLFVFGADWPWLALETTVTLIEGPEVPELSVRLFRIMQGKPAGPLSWFGADLEEDAFRARMVEEQRLIYELAVQRTYGIVTM
jgi:PPOX class probable F420-dependent enzyme